MDILNTSCRLWKAFGAVFNQACRQVQQKKNHIKNTGRLTLTGIEVSLKVFHPWKQLPPATE